MRYGIKTLPDTACVVRLISPTSTTRHRVLGPEPACCFPLPPDLLPDASPSAVFADLARIFACEHLTFDPVHVSHAWQPVLTQEPQQGLQKFDWSQALQTNHYTYATADATVTIHIYNAMVKEYPSKTIPSCLWVFVDIDPISEKGVGLYDDYSPYSAKNSAPIQSVEGLLKKIKKAIKLADATNEVVAGKTWNETENTAMVTFCADLTQALDTYHRTVAA
ncbi:hypothetical protein BDN71DRAFT_1511027 [Pleurotus eryngii]|uniref:Uncharacterized protein n=1 Tax=Pleurotus eryngii TaxID=5323 RepID=A0A9P5ZPB9_PLEER|nr:hypothetical protein BDN71DRAFT_1511027 [Pleurotus eryngii]